MNCAGFDLTPDKPTPCRTHADGLAEQVSYLTAFVSDEPSAVRAEFGADSDINQLVARYGFPDAAPFPTGVADYDVSHQTFLNTLQEAQDAFQRLPEAFRNAYGSWDALTLAALDGSLRDPNVPAAPPEEPPAPAGQTSSPASKSSPQ